MNLEFKNLFMKLKYMYFFFFFCSQIFRYSHNENYMKNCQVVVYVKEILFNFLYSLHTNGQDILDIQYNICHCWQSSVKYSMLVTCSRWRRVSPRLTCSRWRRVGPRLTCSRWRRVGPGLTCSRWKRVGLGLARICPDFLSLQPDIVTSVTDPDPKKSKKKRHIK